MDYLPYLLFPILSSALLLGIGIYILQFRRLPGASPLGFGLILASLWTMLMVLDYTSTDITDKIFLMKCRQPFLFFVPVLWLIMATQHSRREKLLNRMVIAVLLIIPLLASIAVFSDWSHLFRDNYRMSHGAPIALLLFKNGPVYWVNLIYAISLFLASLLLLLHSLQGSQRIYARQTWMIIIATLLPVVTEVIFQTGYAPIRGYSFTPSVFALSGILITYALLRFRLYDVTPFARSIVVDNMADGVLVLDEKNYIVDLNPAACDILGLVAERVIGERVERILKPLADLYALIKLPNATKQEVKLGRGNSEKAYEVTITRIGKQNHMVGRMFVLRDITEQKLLENELRYLSFHDKMTGLYNRTFFEAEVERLQHSRRFPISVIIADADNLKQINDSFGHAAGDRLLFQIALVLKQSFRPDDIVARIGGDEFGVILPGADAKIVANIVQRIFNTLRTGNPLDPGSPIPISIGIATAVRNTELREAIRQADSAMYDEKMGKRKHAVEI